MLLYTPAPRRAALTLLLAVGAELDSARHRQLDHGIAHLRLQWWREESERLASALPSHPWLRAVHMEAADRAAALASLIEAAELDLASEPATGPAPRLVAALFVQLARILLPAPVQLSPADATQLLELGRAVAGLEQQAAPAASLAWLRAQRQSCALMEPRLQPPLAPLLVWTATAACQAQRRVRRAARGSARIAPSPLDGFADNLIAWRCARAASRGHFRIRMDERLG